MTKTTELRRLTVAVPHTAERALARWKPALRVPGDADSRALTKIAELFDQLISEELHDLGDRFTAAELAELVDRFGEKLPVLEGSHVLVADAVDRRCSATLVEKLRALTGPQDLALRLLFARTGPSAERLSLELGAAG
jgi:hypothetical protein